MLRSTQAAHVPPQPPAFHPLPLRVRIGLEETSYTVERLTADGFTIAPATPRAAGTRVHVSFQLPAGLSISFEVMAQPWHELSGLQRFDFVAPDTELLELLLTAADTGLVH